MTEQQFKLFMDDQIKEIKKYKWCESEKAHKDLGKDCCQDWVKKFAKKFRDDYCKSRGWKK